MHFCVANEVPYYKGRAIGPTRLVANKTLRFCDGIRASVVPGGQSDPQTIAEAQGRWVPNSSFPNRSRVVAWRLHAPRIPALRLTPKRAHKRKSIRDAARMLLLA